MEKTGKSYTAARAVLLAGEEPPSTTAPALATSDRAIRERTGRGWEHWFDLLDEWGAAELPQRDGGGFPQARHTFKEGTAARACAYAGIAPRSGASARSEKRKPAVSSGFAYSGGGIRTRDLRL